MSCSSFTPVRCVVFLILTAVLVDCTHASTVHTVFTTECGTYFTWQALGMVYSHRKSGQPGRITRLMSCTDEQWAAYTFKEIVPTHRAPSFTTNPHNHDTYSAYNKPEAVIDWLAHNDVHEDFVLILDADMIMRQPFLPDELGAKQGTAISAYYGYLKGVNNELALKHVPEVLPRNDTHAGPYGRRGDQVGGFILMHKDDLRRMAPLWLKYSEDVRFDPEAWNLTGDVYSTHPGDKPWISEMYGYSFGAAKADVWHRYHTTAMIYPGYYPVEPPKVLHYGLLWEVEAGDGKPPYKFDKHFHYQFAATRCPPWDLEGHHTDAKGGLFPHPPRASVFKTQGLKLLRDLLSIEVPLTLNEAMCEHHEKHCTPSEELTRECAKVRADAAELEAAFHALRLPEMICEDHQPNCKDWAAAGECEKNLDYMQAQCKRACGKCPDQAGKAPDLKVKSSSSGGGGGSGSGTQSEGDTAANGTVISSQAAQRRAEDQSPEVVVAQQKQAVSSPKLDAVLGKEIKAPDTKGDSAPRKDSEAHAAHKRLRRRHKEAQAAGSVQQARVERLTKACTSNSRLSMKQVKECLKQAKAGVAYSAVSHSSGGSSKDAVLKLQDQLSQEALREAGDATSRRLREGTEVHEPSKRAPSGGTSLLTTVGGIGLVLWCATVLLFLCLLPRSRPARQRFIPYRARKESIL